MLDTQLHSFKNNEIRKEEVAPYVITPRPFIISNYLSSAKEKLNKIEFKEFTFSKWKIASLAEFEFQAEYLKSLWREEVGSEDGVVESGVEKLVGGMRDDRFI